MAVLVAVVRIHLCHQALFLELAVLVIPRRYLRHKEITEEQEVVHYPELWVAAAAAALEQQEVMAPQP